MKRYLVEIDDLSNGEYGLILMVVDAPDEDSVKRLVDSAVKDFQLARRI
jgi:hypothetical protein